MLTRLEVDGFKSLRKFAIDLEPFTVLVGPNSAGKSNILEALALLSRLATQSINEAFKGCRGKVVDQFSRHGDDVGRSISFAAEFLAYGPYPQKVDVHLQTRFRYELTIERERSTHNTEKLVARAEYLRALPREADAWVAAHPFFAPYAAYGYVGRDYFITVRDQRANEQRIIDLPSHWSEELRIPRTHTALAHKPSSGLQIKRDLYDFKVLDLGGASLGASSERTDSGALSRDGSNLPTVLAELPDHLIGEIRADLVSLVPGVASFDVTARDDEMHLEFELSGGDRMPARLVSAGTLRVLALLTALRADPRPSVLAIEEPENGIYPGRLRALLDLLREATTCTHEEEAKRALEQFRTEIPSVLGIDRNQLPTQILLTTHSPVALAALRASPVHLRLVDMVRRAEGRVTRARSVGAPGATDPTRLRVSLKEIDALLHAAQGIESA